MSEFFFARDSAASLKMRIGAFFSALAKKINPPGIYEGNSPEIFDAVTFSKVCEQAALDLRHARHRTQEISFGLNVIFV